MIQSLIGTVLLIGALAGAVAAEELALKRRFGIYEVPVLIDNALTLNFILDTGAAEVAIPQDLADSLARTGALLTQRLNDRVFTDASGRSTRRKRVLIRSMQIGSYEVRNVAASIGGHSGLLLLGQSFLARIPTWSIDNRRQTLTIGDLTVKTAATEDVNTADSLGQTALMRACSAGDIAAVRALIARNADLNRKDNAGWNALMIAASRGDVATVQLLRGSGADVNAKNSAGWTALLAATARGDTSMVQALIEAGADVNARNNSGWTALMSAQSRSDASMVQLLKKAGAVN